MGVSVAVKDDSVGFVDVGSSDYVERRFGVRMSNLRKMRRSRGYTLADAAQLIGVSVSYLSRLESGGRRVQAYLVDRFVEIYKCTRADVLGDMINGVYRSGGLSDIPAPERARRRYGHFKYYEIVYDSVTPKKTLPVYVLTKRNLEDGPRFFLLRNPPCTWIYRPHELVGVNCFGLRCGDAFHQCFSQKCVLYLSSADDCTVDDTLLVCTANGKVGLHKCVDVSDGCIRVVPAFNSGLNGGEIVINPKSENEDIYKVIGFQDFLI